MNDLDIVDYERLWEAPEGENYAVQFRRRGERYWSTSELAMPLNEANDLYLRISESLPIGTEVRVVTLSRYPPCSEVKVVKHAEVR